MPRKSLVLFVSLLLCAAMGVAKSFTPKENTRAAVKGYVERAARHVARTGPDCAAFLTPEWKAGDFYIFVADADGKTICHPSPQIVGKPLSEIIDANGKRVGEALGDAAAKGGGWVDYVWARPESKTPEPKSSYVVRITAPDGKSYLVGSGGYGLK